MMITNVYFVRHAHSVFTTEELTRPLSEKGLTDAKKVTRLLLNEKIDKVVSSPYLRARQTVEEIAKVHNVAIELDEGFKERKLMEGNILLRRIV